MERNAELEHSNTTIYGHARAAAGEGPGRFASRSPSPEPGCAAEKFSITPQDLESIMRNFRERQNGEINVDYDHASEMPEVAAGGPIPSAGRIVRIDPPENAGDRKSERK